ncbi:chemotaxis protein CheB [Deinococcus ruber]|uniref:protein-glutamate O-methyltransferase n=1 Tax=Deinococcus ruber TaxID=1848197 RepID=A0A918FI21_9DEIO|nr:chemotaxis protein CheB [Deinococcus ruber]GGR38969.1 chemotaxis protein CheR [Deinococcus ruber]
MSEQSELLPELQQSATVSLPLAVVGIGGSAGALSSYERFFLSLPAGGNMAFVLVPHQHPEQRALMPELLQRCTSLPVSEISDGVALEANCVYVAPPGRDVTLEDNVLRLHDDPLTSPVALPIDRFFTSLAHSQGRRAVAVVLSGSGHDGSQGVKEIRRLGGLVLVQDPVTAEYPSMPSSAVATQTAHQVLPPDELAPRLHAFVTRKPGPVQTEEELLPEEAQASAPLQAILLLIRAQIGHDFTQYKYSTIFRRINRRMQMYSMESAAQYLRFLRETPREVTALYKDLTINVTSFFRDPDAFASLKVQLGQALSDNLRQGVDTFRVWAPGCATGEEAYSIAIILSELLEEFGEQRRIQVQIFATDIDEDSVAVARAGQYSHQIAYVVSAERLERYFTLKSDGYAVRPEVREMVVFALHNTFGDPPFTRLDLLCCRNMLIYLNSNLQKTLIPLFHYALNPGGLLFLGPSETTGLLRDLFVPLDPQWRLFRRAALPVKPLTLGFGTGNMRPPPVSRTEHPPVFRPPRELDISQVVSSVLLGEYTPPSVLVSARGDIVHVVGRTGPFLELALGRIGTNVLDMARDGLRYELSAALRQVAETQREVVQSGLRIEIDGVYRRLDLIVRPLDLPRLEQPLILIVFQLAPQTAPQETAPDNDRLSVIQELERELKYSRGYLQANLEEMEVSVEQLKTTNEELQSTNEELQSTNEELMTSKEELQSLNEELITINAEHQMIITDLAQANDDMKNLLDSAGIATVFLDNDLKIKRFTPRITGVIHLIPSDVGRSITHLVTNLRYDALERDSLEVLRTLTPFETDVQTKDGNWYLMKVAPYRTFDNFIDGVVIVFASITTIKRLERQVQVSALYADEAINAVSAPCIVLDTALRVVSANRAFYQMMHLTAQRARGELLSELMGVGRQVFRSLIPLLREEAPNHGTVKRHVADFDIPFQGRQSIHFSARALTSADGSTDLLLLTLEDPADESEALS